MAYDIVSAEYGWSDEQIGDLPLKRLRQVVAAIRSRKFLASRDDNSRFSWLGRHLGALIAAGYEVEEGAENKGVTYAEGLAYDDIERAALKAAREVTEEAPAEPEVGSFERLMGAIGRTQG